MAGVFVALAGAGPASAATFCVNASGCSGTNESTLQLALTAAATTGSGPDTVVVGDPGAAPADGYSYAPSDDSVNPVEVVGQGAGTVLTTVNADKTVLYLGRNSRSSVRDLTVQVNGYGVGVRLAGTVRNLTINGGIAGVGLTPNDDAAPVPSAVLGSRVTILPLGSYAIDVQSGSGPLTKLEDDSLQGGSGATVRTDSAGTVAATRLRMVCTDDCFYQGAGTVSLEDSVLRATATSVAFRGLGLDSPVSGDARLDANHLTIYGNADPNSVGASVHARSSGRTATLSLRNSIIRNVATSLSRTASVGSGTTKADATIAYSDFDPVHVVDSNGTGGSGAFTFGAGNIDQNPGFLDPAADDFRFAAGSPVVDTGDPAGLAAGESPTDVLGNPRISGPRRDIGAIEYQYPPPPPPPPPAEGAPVISSLTQAAKKWREPKNPALATETRKKKVPVGTTFNYTLDKPATVTLAFTQSMPGRKVAGKCVAQKRANKKKHKCKRTITVGTLTFAGHPGVNKVHFQGRISATKKLKPGKYTVAIHATTAHGLTSTPKTLTFTIVK